MYIITIVLAHIWLLGAAWTDLKCRKVSNRWCLCGVIAATVLLIVQSILEKDGLTFLIGRILAALFAGGFLLLGTVIRRGGIGMGDVKVFFVLGLLLGAERVGMMLFLTLVAALIIAAVGLISRKMSRKYQLPLCTFAYIAMVVLCLGNG